MVYVWYMYVCMYVRMYVCVRREGVHICVCVCSGHYHNVGASVYVQYICHVALPLSPTQVLCAYLKDDL